MMLLAACGLETPPATTAAGLLMPSPLQGFEDIGILDEVASDLLSSMDEVEVNEEEALFEVGHAARLAYVPAEPKHPHLLRAWGGRNKCAATRSNVGSPERSHSWIPL